MRGLRDTRGLTTVRSHFGLSGIPLYIPSGVYAPISPYAPCYTETWQPTRGKHYPILHTDSANRPHSIRCSAAAMQFTRFGTFKRTRYYYSPSPIYRQPIMAIHACINSHKYTYIHSYADTYVPTHIHSFACNCITA